MKHVAHLSSIFLFLLITLVNGVNRSFKILVDGKEITWNECMLARAAHRISIGIKPLEADYRYMLGLVLRRIRSILAREEKDRTISVFVGLLRRTRSKKQACSLKTNDDNFTKERLWFLRRAAACLGLSKHKKLLFYLQSAVCSLESISKISGNSYSQPKQHDVIHRRWQSKFLRRDQTKLKIRDFLILLDVNEALAKMLRRFKKTIRS